MHFVFVPNRGNFWLKSKYLYNEYCIVIYQSYGFEEEIHENVAVEEEVQSVVFLKHLEVWFHSCLFQLTEDYTVTYML